MILSCYLPIILYVFSYKIKVISMSYDFDGNIEIELDKEGKLIKLPYPLAVVSRTSKVDDLLNKDFENIHKITFNNCNF